MHKKLLAISMSAAVLTSIALLTAPTGNKTVFADNTTAATSSAAQSQTPSALPTSSSIFNSTSTGDHSTDGSSIGQNKVTKVAAADQVAVDPDTTPGVRKACPNQYRL